MKTTLLGLTAFAVAVLALHHAPAPTFEPPELPSMQAINAIVGDASFYEAYGTAPDAMSDEDLRIRTHLAYVLQRLGDVPAAEVPADLRAARARNLSRLADYIALGTFPRNPTSVRVRTPNFLDAQGRICAVGYLVREDLGATAVQAINREYQFAHIQDMESAALAAWQETSGLTVLELAAIQPAYCPDDPNCGGVPPPLASSEPNVTAAEISVGGSGLALAAFNGWQLAHGRKNTVLGLGSIGVGFASVALAMRSDAPASRFNAAAGALAILTGLLQASRSSATPQAAAAAPRLQLQPMIRDGGTQVLAVQVRF